MRDSYTLNVATGDVRVDGKVVAETEKTSHVWVRPREGTQSNTDGHIVIFKELVKGFSKEVKLTRRLTTF